MAEMRAFDGIYYCPWTGLDHCVSDGGCKDFADCPAREQEEKWNTHTRT